MRRVVRSLFGVLRPRGLLVARPCATSPRCFSIKEPRSAQVGIETFRANNREKEQRERRFGVFFAPPTQAYFKDSFVARLPTRSSVEFVRIFLLAYGFSWSNDDVYRFQHGVRLFLSLQHCLSLRGEAGLPPVPGRILLQFGISPVSGMSLTLIIIIYFLLLNTCYIVMVLLCRACTRLFVCCNRRAIEN